MGQLTMTQNAGFGILSGEFLQQLIQCVFLGFGARVFGFAFCIQTAFIHDTEGTVVVVAGMHTLDGLWQEWDDTAIVAHVVVIGALAVLGLAAGYQVLHAERPVTGVGHTVHDQHFHIVMLQWFIILAHKPNSLMFQSQYGPQLCTASVPAIVVMTVARNLSTLATLIQFTFTIFEKLI